MLTSILRTVVPAFWGSWIGWILASVPALEPLRANLLAYGDLAVPVTRSDHDWRVVSAPAPARAAVARLAGSNRSWFSTITFLRQGCYSR